MSARLGTLRSGMRAPAAGGRGAAQADGAPAC